MCLGIPGRVVTIDPTNPHLAMVEVTGVRRAINVGLLDEEGSRAQVGDWVLIHVGFAMSKIDEEEAARALEGLRLMGPELQQFLES